jgi:hypothetical protein
MLQEHVKSAFPHKTVIIPEDAGFAVLKGAVQFGFNPKVINPRIIRFTYGISTNMVENPPTIIIMSVLATGVCRNIPPRCWTICLHDS